MAVKKSLIKIRKYFASSGHDHYDGRLNGKGSRLCALAKILPGGSTPEKRSGKGWELFDSKYIESKDKILYIFAKYEYEVVEDETVEGLKQEVSQLKEQVQKLVEQNDTVKESTSLFD